MCIYIYIYIYIIVCSRAPRARRRCSARPRTARWGRPRLAPWAPIHHIIAVVYMCVYVYIYIYIEREREIDRDRERERDLLSYLCICLFIYVCIDLCIYLCWRPGRRFIHVCLCVWCVSCV